MDNFHWIWMSSIFRMNFEGDEGTAYLLQQFWMIRIISPYLPMTEGVGDGGVAGEPEGPIELPPL